MEYLLRFLLVYSVLLSGCARESQTEYQAIPVYLGITSYTGELIRVKVNDQMIYEKITPKSRFDSTFYSFDDTLMINSAKSPSQEKLLIHLESFFHGSKLIDTLFRVSQEGLEDIGIGISQPLPLYEAWENRTLPLDEYIMKYKRNVVLDRNYTKQMHRLLAPPKD